MGHIFISYAHTDRDYARKLADNLLANGFDVWIDDRIDFGSRWMRVIFDAVDTCDAFIVIMTPASYEREWVEKEYLRAGEQKKPSFPLLLDGKVFPFFVGIQYYDVHGGMLPERNFLERLRTFSIPAATSGQDVAAVPQQQVKQEFETRTTEAATSNAVPARKRRSRSFVARAAALIIILILVTLAYVWFSGGSGVPSATLNAPTLSLVTPTTSSASNASDLIVFNIDSTRSKVSFSLDEALNGSQHSVVGSTDQVAGQIAVDFANPANTQIGEIKIDARTLTTDNELRNRAIRGQILQSSQDQYEFISFKPTALTGLPASVTLGTTYSLRVTGDLTIRDITKSVSFDMTVIPYSHTRIEGSASAIIQRTDYDLTIPTVPGVTDVDQVVHLEIDFVAAAS